jgi:hypothetical protein
MPDEGSEASSAAHCGRGESTGVLNDETKVMERGVTRAAKLSHKGIELRLERSRGVGTGGGRKCGGRDAMSGERCEPEDSETKASTTVARNSTKAEQSGRHTQSAARRQGQSAKREDLRRLGTGRERTLRLGNHENHGKVGRKRRRLKTRSESTGAKCGSRRAAQDAHRAITAKDLLACAAPNSSGRGRSAPRA